VKLEGSALVLAINKFHSDSYVSSGMVPSTFKKKIHTHTFRVKNKAILNAVNKQAVYEDYLFIPFKKDTLYEYL